MFVHHDDYLKMLKNLKYYMECSLEFVEMGFDGNLKKYYPIVRCGDVLRYFNHYESFEEAENCWNRRRKRIDWDNLFIEFFDEDKKLVDEFLSLPYNNKVCFAPFSMKHKNVISLDYKMYDINNPFWKEVMRSLYSIRYDIFELLLNYEIVLLSDLKSLSGKK